MSQKVLIVGAGSGLSASLARQCHAASMKVALAARDGTALADVLKRHLRNKCETVKSHLESKMPKARSN